MRSADLLYPIFQHGEGYDDIERFGSRDKGNSGGGIPLAWYRKQEQNGQYDQAQHPADGNTRFLKKSTRRPMEHVCGLAVQRLTRRRGFD